MLRTRFFDEAVVRALDGITFVAADSTEARLTVPPRDVALQWVADAGWTVLTVSDGTDADPSSPHRLLVRAVRA